VLGGLVGLDGLNPSPSNSKGRHKKNIKDEVLRLSTLTAEAKIIEKEKMRKSDKKKWGRMLR
jgi:hypothetical protein